MAIDPLTAITPNDGVASPDNAAINATGPSATDGTPLTAIGMNNYWHGRQQALLNYAGLTPTGVVESNTVSQELEAIKLGFGVGPGWVRRRDIEDSPAVHGDRSILLAEQGVLIASYPLLDAACWIGGNTAAQVAAAAAGGKYYRSSDAGGATGDAAGPYLQLPANPSPMGLKQYSQAATSGLTVTDTNWTTTSAIFVPYQIIDNGGSAVWRLKFNIHGVFSVATNTATLLISNVTFNFSQSVSAITSGATWAVGRAFGGNLLLDAGANNANWYTSGDVELTSKPTWVDDFEPVYAITY